MGCVALRSHSFNESFDERIEENFYLDLPTKLSALKASQSVVSLVSRARRGMLGVYACMHPFMYVCVAK